MTSLFSGIPSLRYDARIVPRASALPLALLASTWMTFERSPRQSAVGRLIGQTLCRTSGRAANNCTTCFAGRPKSTALARKV